MIAMASGTSVSGRMDVGVGRLSSATAAPLYRSALALFLGRRLFCCSQVSLGHRNY